LSDTKDDATSQGLNGSPRAQSPLDGIRNHNNDNKFSRPDNVVPPPMEELIGDKPRVKMKRVKKKPVKKPRVKLTSVQSADRIVCVMSKKLEAAHTKMVKARYHVESAERYQRDYNHARYDYEMCIHRLKDAESILEHETDQERMFLSGNTKDKCYRLGPLWRLSSRDLQYEEVWQKDMKPAEVIAWVDWKEYVKAKGLFTTYDAVADIHILCIHPKDQDLIWDVRREYALQFGHDYYDGPSALVTKTDITDVMHKYFIKDLSDIIIAYSEARTRLMLEVPLPNVCKEYPEGFRYSGIRYCYVYNSHHRINRCVNCLANGDHKTRMLYNKQRKLKVFYS